MASNAREAYSRDLETKRHLKCCSDQLAYRWLVILPKSPQLAILDDDFVVSLRFRLGVPCFHDLPDRCPFC